MTTEHGTKPASDTGRAVGSPVHQPIMDLAVDCCRCRRGRRCRLERTQSPR